MDELQILTVSTECFDDAIAYLSDEVSSDERSSILGAWTSELGALNKIVILSQWETERSLDSVPSSALEDALRCSAFKTMILEADRILLKRLDPFRNVVNSGNHTFELREYHFNPSRMNEYQTLLQSALPAREIYSGFVGWWEALTGIRERIFLLWKYEDLAHRSAVRKAASDDPAWKSALVAVSPTIKTMSSSILRPVSFSPLR